MRQPSEGIPGQLEHVLANFRIIGHVRPKPACSCYDHIAQAVAMCRSIGRDMADQGLLAHVLASRFADHLPLCWQSVIHVHKGVELDRSLLAKWPSCSAMLRQLLADAPAWQVAVATKRYVADMPIPVLASGNGEHQAGRWWMGASGGRASCDATPPVVRFIYTPYHKAINPKQHLESFSRTLQADAYDGCQAIYKTRHVAKTACWAQVQRQFYELHAAYANALNIESLERIGTRYKLEEPIPGKPPDERSAYRQAQARSPLDRLHAWRSVTLSRKSGMGWAILYARSKWETPTRYCDNERPEIDSLPIENALRGGAIGRFNCLFACANTGGKRSAAIYSPGGTAKLRGINPEAQQRYVLSRIADWVVDHVEGFLSWALTERFPVPASPPRC